MQAAKPAADAGVPQLSTSYADTMAHNPKPVSSGDDLERFDRPGRYSGGSISEEPTHKIADGDTLVRLAERYLGDGERWPELFAFNRDVLSAPDLLPLGTELRIPPHARLPPAGPATVQNLAAAGGPPARSSEMPLIPVAAPVMAGGPSGGIRRLPPIVEQDSPRFNPPPTVAPVGRILRVAPQTYVVQPGDTLASIAQKLYGDVRGQALLYEANRDRLRQAEDLRPGLVLVVPAAGARERSRFRLASRRGVPRAGHHSEVT